MSNIEKYTSILSGAMSSQTYDNRRLVGVHAERVSDVSSTDYPGVYPGEDHSWNLENFKKVQWPKASGKCVV